MQELLSPPARYPEPGIAPSDLDVVREITNNSGGRLPKTALSFFREANGFVPLVEWLDRLAAAARDSCIERLEQLEANGHELRRPHAENLGRGIYELRTKHMGVNYRMLYFFYGRAAVIVTQGFEKQQAAVPDREILLALARKRTFELDPATHSTRGGN